jgi:hypothetical protein
MFGIDVDQKFITLLGLGFSGAGVVFGVISAETIPLYASIAAGLAVSGIYIWRAPHNADARMQSEFLRERIGLLQGDIRDLNEHHRKAIAELTKERDEARIQVSILKEAALDQALKIHEFEERLDADSDPPGAGG